MCFPATELLARNLKSGARVFEYGSGGSTIYFARTAREVVSVEHEPLWYQRVEAEIARRGLTNVDYKLCEPEVDPSFDHGKIADPQAYFSADDKSAGHSFKKYVRIIESYPDGYFDLVVVDGRARPSCLMHALKKVKRGGILLLDQSERPYYLTGVPELHDTNQWSMERFMAPLPYSLHFTEATFFTKK
jgi:predicted O-methyltransferase YrrM